MVHTNGVVCGAGEQQQRSSSGVSHRDRDERLRQLREKQQNERQQKLEELKEHVSIYIHYMDTSFDIPITYMLCRR